MRLVCLHMETRGIKAPVGACCEVCGPDGRRVEAEVVGRGAAVALEAAVETPAEEGAKAAVGQVVVTAAR